MLITDVRTRKIILERREEWADALRHNGYEQGRTYLKAVSGTRTTWCCLGVVCDIMGKQAGVREIKGISRVSENSVVRLPIAFAGKSGTSETFLPIEMRKYLGLSHHSEALLAKMNDDNIPFSTIAGCLHHLPVETE